MIARPPRLTQAAALMLVAASFACAKDRPAPAPIAKVFEFGSRRVQITVPPGWDAIDQGRQKRLREGEFAIVLEYLEPPASLPHDLDALIDWGLAAIDAGVGHDQRREVKSRRAVTVDGREAMEIETWSRLDHTSPQLFFLVRDGDALLVLRTERTVFDQEQRAAFEAIRASLGFPQTQSVRQGQTVKE